jgi:hypothetical protein
VAVCVTKAFTTLEARRRERAFEDFRRQWWWFNDANAQHVHQFSAAWELLRRTRAFNHLHEKMIRWRAAFEGSTQASFAGVVQKGKLMASLHEMLPGTVEAPTELHDMLQVWQNMLANGWTPEKTYLQASTHSAVQCMLPDGKSVCIPPTHGGKNHGVPLILPRQVASRGHTSLVVELCDIRHEADRTQVAHVSGSVGPTQTLQFLVKNGKTLILKDGNFIAVQFPLNHPPEALKPLLAEWLNSLEQGKEWVRPPNAEDIYSRGPSLLIATANPLEVIAFFHADQPRNVIERGFKTLLRPERVAKQIPLLRGEWIEWDFAERVKYNTRGTSREELFKQAEAAWLEAERYGRPAQQSSTRPIRPAEDLANLACADCAPYYRRKRTELPDALPTNIRNDPDFNKRMATGERLICDQDDLFLPLVQSA